MFDNRTACFIILIGIKLITSLYERSVKEFFSLYLHVDYRAHEYILTKLKKLNFNPQDYFLNNKHKIH